MRTEIEVAADVLFELRLANLLPKRVMPEACRVVGITQDDLLDALRRYQGRADRSAPRPTSRPVEAGAEREVPVEAEPEPVRPEPEAKRPEPKFRKPTTPKPNPTRRRARRKIDGVAHLHCTRCDRWLPEEEAFLMRSDRNARVTYCRDCRATYHRERRVTTRVLDEMDRVGVRFVLDGDSNLVGVACARCGERFEASDAVEGAFSPVHVRCSEKP